jgi:hypothetical protein
MTRPAAITIGQFERPTLSRDGRTMVVRIPISLRRQGGRKQVVTPADATPWMPPPSRVDGTIVKALVRAHRWRSMLESKVSTVRDLAKAEHINESGYAEKLADYQAARASFESEALPYWQSVADKRRLRNEKRRKSEVVALEDYVLTQPPIYAGPPEPADPDELGGERPKADRPPVPVVADFVRNAEDQFGIAWHELGLDKTQNKLAILDDGDMRLDQVKIIARRIGVTETDVI